MRSGSKTPAVNSSVTAVGWGSQEITGEIPVTNLATINKKVAACRESGNYIFPSGAPVYICYSAKGGSACIGDSGGENLYPTLN